MAMVFNLKIKKYKYVPDAQNKKKETPDQGVSE